MKNSKNASLMFRLFVPVLFVLIAVIGLQYVLYAETGYEMKMSRSLPAKISGWVRTSIINAEKVDPGAGMGVYYKLKDASTAVCIYNNNLKSIPNGTDSNAVKTEFGKYLNTFSDLLLKNFYQTANKIESSKIVLGQSKKMNFFYVKYKTTKRNIVNVEWIFLTGLKDHFIEIVVSSPNGTMTDKEIKSFVSDLADKILAL